jgi:hypothetical protein
VLVLLWKTKMHPLSWFSIACVLLGAGTFASANSSSCTAYTLSAIVSNDLQTVAIVSTNRTFSAALAVNGILPCASLLALAHVRLFGNAPVCQWLGPNTLQIQLSLNATLLPPVTVSVRDTAFDDAPVELELTTVTPCLVAAPLAPLSVVVTLMAPATVCDAVTLDASFSTGNGRRPWVYDWMLLSTSPVINSSGIVAALRQGALMQVTALKLDAQLLPVGVTYTFAVRLTNWLGYAGVGVISPYC